MLHNKLDHDGDERPRDLRSRTRGQVVRRMTALTGAAVLALALTAAAPALASGSGSSHHQAPDYSYSINFVVETPSPYGVAGAGGVFNVDIEAVALNATGNGWLSSAKGYKPGIATKAAGIGHPDPFAPGLVVLLSTTPAKAGGPDANLAGVFQLTDVATSKGGKAEVIADWEVGKAGAFGKGNKTTLTAFLVSGTAPGIVTGSVKPISNVVKVTFTIGGSASPTPYT
jgi:hypothetical protein